MWHKSNFFTSTNPIERMFTLIANSGIQLFSKRIEIDTSRRFEEWYHEWYDQDTGEWKLELVYELKTEDYTVYYRKADLIRGGFLASTDTEITIAELREAGIEPLKVDDQICTGVQGEIFSLTLTSRYNKISSLEGHWLPMPYFFKQTARRFKFGPLNWARAMFIPVQDEEGDSTKIRYDVVLAFDTHTTYQHPGLNENPDFPDLFRTDMDFGLCTNPLYLLDYCSSGCQWSYINEYLLKLVHPEIANLNQLRGANVHRMAYAASYLYLMTYLGKNELLPNVKLYKDVDVETQNVDMVVDIGNSRTTALLVEDNSNFNQIRPLKLTDFTNLIEFDEETSKIKTNDDPFDMRLAFRKVNFGNFGLKDSRQFIYPSLVRLGAEANSLIHRASNQMTRLNSLSTYSSPKRYLWDGRENQEEWEFLVMPGEEDDHVLSIEGLTPGIKSDGTFTADDDGGLTYHYSRRSLMTFAFLEMIVQARMQLNSESHRSILHGLGHIERPRKIKRLIVTCPTAMSKLEREALSRCATDAVRLLARFEGDTSPRTEVIPNLRNVDEEHDEWYYDEATCSQLVYMYGEIGHKYKGRCGEFFELYGKPDEETGKPSLTVGSLDIGAGTSDLMISRYTYVKDDITVVTPEPLFYDSFYFAGDDMLNGLIKNAMLLNESSAFRSALADLTPIAYRQRIKDFFGTDHNGQTVADRILRKDFNIQYSVPLMYRFLELMNEESKDCVVSYEDVFGDCPPNPAVIEGFRNRVGIDVRTLDWKFNRNEIAAIIEKEFEPLLKKVATIMYAYACDIVLLSGRPASLSPVRDIFLRYYAVSPNRLIILNNYYVGDWYPFGSNTGYITNPKTIVAVGGLIAHYASELSNLNKFVIDLDKLRKGLKSTVNYIEASRDSVTPDYVITPESNVGDLIVSQIPMNLNVRQLGLDSYPGRTLYTIDFDRAKMVDRVQHQSIINNGSTLTDARASALVQEQIEKLRYRMPFKVTLERDYTDKEKLTITTVLDKNNEEIPAGNIEIHIQSLGADEKYWLDSGAFTF